MSYPPLPSTLRPQKEFSRILEKKTIEACYTVLIDEFSSNFVRPMLASPKIMALPEVIMGMLLTTLETAAQ